MQQQANLLSSYASQAGTAVQSPSLPSQQNGINGGGGLSPSPGSALTPSAAAALAGLHSNRDFTPDDFPALGGFGSVDLSQHTNSAGSGTSGNTNGNGNGNGSNGMSSLLGVGAGQARPTPGTPTGGQEQASAAAALQHQQQHRANLLGSMNGASSPANALQARTVSGQQPFPSETDKRALPPLPPQPATHPGPPPLHQVHQVSLSPLLISHQPQTGLQQPYHPPSLLPRHLYHQAFNYLHNLKEQSVQLA
ncbi:hypothetical protein P7C70_g8140, partial [Phenoliferia sp. Uapishka_3]